MSAIGGWFVMGVFIPTEVVSVTFVEQTPAHATLLGRYSKGEPLTPAIGHPKGLSEVIDMLAKLNSASVVDLRRWVMLPDISEQVKQAIVNQLSAIDPQGTFHLLKHEDWFYRVIGIPLAEWAKTDLPAALEASLFHQNGGSVYDMLEGLDESKWEDVYQAFLSMGLDRQFPEAQRRLLNQMSSREPEKALERLMALDLVRTAEDRQGESFKYLLGNWYQKDPDAFLKWLDRPENTEVKEIGMNAIAESVLRAEGLEGLDRVWNDLDDDQRSRLAKSYMFRSDDVEGLLGWIDTNVESPKLHQEMLLNLISHVESPDQMQEIVSRLDADFNDSNLMHRIKNQAREWAGKYSEELESWAERVENPHVRNAVRRALMESWTTENPIETIERWEEFSDAFEGDQSQLIAELTRSLEVMIGGDPLDLVNYFPEELREMAAREYASKLTFEDPKEALRIIDKMPPGKETDHRKRAALAFLVNHDPQDAIERLEVMPEGADKEVDSRNIADQWLRYDFDGAHEWVESLPASPSRDRAADQIVRHGAVHRPEEVLTMALGISDREIRDRLLRESVLELARRDPEMAEKHVEAVGFPPDLADAAVGWIDQERKLKMHFQRGSEE